MRLGLHFAFGEDGSLTARNGGPTLTFTRTGLRSLRDNEGYIRYMLDDEPGFEGAKLANNLCRNSADMSDTAWSAGANATSVGNAEDPYGAANNAFTITDDATNAAHYIRLTNNSALDVTKPRLLSVFVKAGTGRYLAMASREINSGNTQWNNVFDTEAGEWVVKGTSGNDGHGQRQLPGGWWRIWYRDSTNSVAYDDFSVGINNDGTLAGNQYSGSGDTMIVYGAQISTIAGAWVSENIDTNSEADNAWQLSQEGGAPINVTGEVEPPREIAALNPTILECPDDDAGGTGTVRHLISDTMPRAGDYMASFYIKLEENSPTEWIVVRQTGFGLPNGWSAGSIYFNIRTGQVGSTPTTSGFYGIRDKGNGWYRIWYHWRNDSQDLLGQSINVYQVLGDNGTLSTTPRDGTRRVYVCGAMTHALKPNMTEPLPYLPTYGVAQTNYEAPNYIETTTEALSAWSGPCDGLLAEEERTNICLHSEDWTNAAWLKAGQSTITANAAIAPDGSPSADLLIDDGLGGGPGNIRTHQAITVATNTRYVHSVFAKADQLGWVYLTWANGGVANVEQYFDLVNGVLGTGGAGVDIAHIDDYGNGWYRCSMAFTSDAVDTLGENRIYVAEADNDNLVDFDGTSSILLWGADFEASPSGSPSTYISTAGTSVVRNLEVPQMTDVAWFREDEGSWFTEAAPFNLNETGWIWQIAAGIQDYHGHGKNFNGSAHEARAFTNVGDDGVVNGVSWVRNEFSRMASSYIVDELVGYAKGIQMTVDTSVSLPSLPPTQFLINDDPNGGGEFNGIIKEIRWYDTRLKREQLRRMTLVGTRQSFPGFKNQDSTLAWSRAMTARSREAGIERQPLE